MCDLKVVMTSCHCRVGGRLVVESRVNLDISGEH